MTSPPDAIAELLRIRDMAKDVPVGCVIWNSYRRASMAFTSSEAFAELLADAQAWRDLVARSGAPIAAIAKESGNG